MNEAKVVIGANYGDEGKGAAVDRLATEAGAQCLVHGEFVISVAVGQCSVSSWPQNEMGL